MRLARLLLAGGNMSTTATLASIRAILSMSSPSTPVPIVATQSEHPYERLNRFRHGRLLSRGIRVCWPVAMEQRVFAEM